MISQVPNSLENWPSVGVRRASINSFGYGGTNAHAIIEEASTCGAVIAPKAGPQNIDKVNGLNGIDVEAMHSAQKPMIPRQVFSIYGKTRESCLAQMAAMGQYIMEKSTHQKPEFLRSLSYTLCSHRSRLPWITAISASSFEGLLECFDTNRVMPSRTPTATCIRFVFTGQGSQWYAMGRELIKTQPVFSASIKRSDIHVKSLGAKWSILGIFSA